MSTAIAAVLGLIAGAIGWLVLGHQRVTRPIVEERRQAYASLVVETDLADTSAVLSWSPRNRMSIAIFDALLAMQDAGADQVAIANVVSSCAEGYSFPTNLDRDQPVDGLAPPTQVELLTRAVLERWPADRLRDELGSWAQRRTDVQ